jgi:predicted HicB family RNase H-like nuclease
MENDADNSLVSSKLSFEDLKGINQHGIEYWSARSLQPCLGYSQWGRFEKAIQKAIESCKQSGNNPQNHFAGARKMVGIGSQADRELEDYHLSRFACYLIAQNGDPRKPEIAQAQKYFAMQVSQIIQKCPQATMSGKKNLDEWIRTTDPQHPMLVR